MIYLNAMPRSLVLEYCAQYEDKIAFSVREWGKIWFLLDEYTQSIFYITLVCAIYPHQSTQIIQLKYNKFRSVR